MLWGGGVKQFFPIAPVLNIHDSRDFAQVRDENAIKDIMKPAEESLWFYKRSLDDISLKLFEQSNDILYRLFTDSHHNFYFKLFYDLVMFPKKIRGYFRAKSNKKLDRSK